MYMTILDPMQTMACCNMQSCYPPGAAVVTDLLTISSFHKQHQTMKLGIFQYSSLH